MDKEAVLEDLEKKLEEHPEVFQAIALADKSDLDGDE